jgi:hypothetical protein
MTSKQRRIAVSERERQKIRRYANNNPLERQIAIAAWATREFGRKINQSTICDTLKSKYAYLDEKHLPRGVAGNTRLYSAEYPVLEKALWEWVLRMEGSKLPINGEMIQAAAHALWIKMPDFELIKEPKWSQGWLHGFKKRHKIKKYKQSGESASADISGATDAIHEIKELIKQYASKDIYNSDETGLFWLMTPDNTLASRPQSGHKKEKKRLTVFPTCNADGSHKLDLWILGHFKNPRPFGPQLRYINQLPFVYRSNKKAWMTAVLFMEYLHWFDAQMQGRKVLLLVDGFSAHESAVKQMQEEAGENYLVHTTVRFLPPNTTSIYQPMDQGIINSLKVHYRKTWLEHMVAATLCGGDPLKETTILMAVHWVIDAWRNKVSADTISNCWRHSQLFGPIFGPQPKPREWSEKAHEQQLALEVSELRRLANQLAGSGHIREVMAISNFVNPPEEEIVDSSDDLLDHIAETFSELELEDSETTVEDQSPEPLPVSEAMKAVSSLLQFYQQQEDVDLASLSHLSRIQRQVTNIRLRQKSSGGQTTLDMYF